MVGIDLSGKTALVTGASQGLGEAIVTRLHEAGASVIVNYFPDDGGLNERRASDVVRKLGDRAVACGADVRARNAVAVMMERAMKTFHRLDIVVNSAGVIRDRTLRNMSHEDWEFVLETNLTGTFNVCKAALDHLADGGRIVNISSISAYLGFFGQANYAASKAGVAALSRVLARESAKRAITVNVVAPGVVLTEMGLTIPEEIRAEMLRSIPLGRFGEPREVADAVLFLCSDMASYMTGQVLHVNGGWV